MRTTLTVNQFLCHLEPEAQGAVLLTRESMLEFLRERMSGLDEESAQTRRDLYAAARARLEGRRVRVDALPDEREAASAVLYAVAKLGDWLRARAESENAVTARQLVNRQGAQRASLEIAARSRASLERAGHAAHPIREVGEASPVKRWRTGYGGAGGPVTASDFYPRANLIVTVRAGTREAARLVCRADRLGEIVAGLEGGKG